MITIRLCDIIIVSYFLHQKNTKRFEAMRDVDVMYIANCVKDLQFNDSFIKSVSLAFGMVLGTLRILHVPNENNILS